MIRKTFMDIHSTFWKSYSGRFDSGSIKLDLDGESG